MRTHTTYCNLCDEQIILDTSGLINGAAFIRIRGEARVVLSSNPDRSRQHVCFDCLKALNESVEFVKDPMRIDPTKDMYKALFPQESMYPEQDFDDLAKQEPDPVEDPGNAT